MRYVFVFLRLYSMRDPKSDITPDGGASGKKPRWRRIVRWTIIGISAVMLLCVAAVGTAVYLLTPDALTPMVSKYSRDYLDAEVTARKVELKFWSTFPKVWLDIEELKVVSDKLKGLPAGIRDSLPQDADTLLSVGHFSGGVNVWAMMSGTVMLYDVKFDKPAINIVQVNDTLANYMIVPPGEVNDSTDSPFPFISINRFAITGGAPLRFFSLRDSMDVTVDLVTTTLDGSATPTYSLDIKGSGAGKIASGLTLPLMPFGADGRIDWNQRKPRELALRDFTLSANGVSLTMNANLEFGDNILFNGLEIWGTKIKADNIISIIPEKYLGSMAGIETDLEADLSLKLLKPYSTGDKSLPSVQFDLSIPQGKLDYDRIHLNRINADLTATVNGEDPDLSTLEIRRLALNGRSLNFSLSGTADHLISDPRIEARFDGRLNISTLPRMLWRKLGFSAKGILRGNTSLRFRKSDLNARNFHRLMADGSLSLDGFDLVSRDSSLQAMTGKMTLEFGTNARIRVSDSIRADSLLRLSLNADTIVFTGSGLSLSAGRLNAVAAARNRSGSMDTSRINPIGFSVKAGRLRMRSAEDSARFTMRDAAVKATLKRYNGEAKAPLLSLEIAAKRAMYADTLSRVSLSDAVITASLHPSGRRRAQTDSLRRARWQQRRRAEDSIRAARGLENFDFDVDSGVVSWLRHWKASGTIKARRGRLLTPFFPVKNVLRNVDMTFGTDSIVFRDTRYNMGRSDFLINGSISNISRALTSRRGSPLKINLDIKSDTININEIYEAAMAGSAFAAKADKSISLSENRSDSDLQASIDSNFNSYEQAAFVVPANIDASLNIFANEVLYADIWFQRFTGRVGMHDGAIHLDRLAGYTPIGSLDLTALYSAPNRQDVSFAAGAVVRSLRLKEFLHLLPEIDSVLPLLREVDGIVTADLALTTDIDSVMNLKFNTLHLLLKLSGDSLVLVDSKTFRTMSKWLMFKHKDRNVINSMKVELMIKDTKLDVFPFVFDIDRYKLGVAGGNTLDMDLDYHVAVLKSPIPFKFGITIKGKPDHLKIRLGRANFDENKVAFSRQLTDTLRMNLIHEIQEVFSFGARNGRRTKLLMDSPKYRPGEFLVSDTLTHADSVIFIQGGVIEGPPVPPFPQTDNPAQKDKKEKHRKKK